MMLIIVSYVLFFNAIVTQIIDTKFSVTYVEPKSCENAVSVGVEKFATYFNTYSFGCVPCAQNTTCQKTSADGKRCECQLDYRIVNEFNGGIVCSPCGEKQVVSLDGRECLDCFNGKCKCDRAKSELTVERNIVGSWQDGIQAIRCSSCEYNTSLVAIDRCSRCDKILSVHPKSNCVCPANWTNGNDCLREQPDRNYLNPEMFFVRFAGTSFISSYVSNRGRQAYWSCHISVKNYRSCQLLANLCVLQLYSRSESLCQAYKELSQQLTASTQPSVRTDSQNAWRTKQSDFNTPNLIYEPIEIYLTNSTAITNIYRVRPGLWRNPHLKSTLELLVSVHDADGTYIGMKPVTDGMLQLCTMPKPYLNAAFDFGVFYDQACYVPASTLIHNATLFYELWISFEVDGVQMLHAVPVIFSNNESHTSPFLCDSDYKSRTFVSRFFISESVTGNNKYIRVARNIELHIIQQQETSGQIYAPYLFINYADIEDFSSNIHVEFHVVYHEDCRSAHVPLFVAMCCLMMAGAAGFSLVLTMKRWKRTGRRGCDVMFVVKWLVLSCDHLSNALFIVLFCASFIWFIIYKSQEIVVLVNPNPVDWLFPATIVLAFLLKLVSIVNIAVRIVTVGVFFVDREMPCMCSSTSSIFTKSLSSAPASIWRSYLVLKKYVRMMSSQRLDPAMRIMLSLLLVEFAFGWSAVSADPWWSVGAAEPRQHPVYKDAGSNIALRFACLSLSYFVIAILQEGWSLVCKRIFALSVTNLIDLCSVANISIFIFDHHLYGYYIHGSCCHSNSDVDLLTWYINLSCEQENMKRSRGLVAGESVQTFTVAVPRQMRALYDRLMIPVLTNRPVPSGFLGARLHRLSERSREVILSPQTERSLVAYDLVNKFMIAFIDHDFNEFDYIVRNRRFDELIFNFEICTPHENGFFYRDYKFEFTAATLYGNQLSLIVFEVLLMATCDTFFYDFVVDSCITFVVVCILLEVFCHGIGLVNVAKKSLLDKRFIL